MIVSASEAGIRKAADLLRQGGLIVFPTETYYGLGADPFNPEALKRLFAVKRRSPDKPILVLIAELGQAQLLARNIPPDLARLASRFWPGPLTLVCDARLDLPKLLTGGTGTIGIRQSPAPTAALLLAEFGRPATATSANRSGEPAALTAVEAEEAFGEEVDLVLDGGLAPGGACSTLVGWDSQGPRCLREGAVSFAEVVSFLDKERRRSVDS